MDRDLAGLDAFAAEPPNGSLGRAASDRRRVLEVRQAASGGHPIVALHRVALSREGLTEEAMGGGLIAPEETLAVAVDDAGMARTCLLYTSPSPRDRG